MENKEVRMRTFYVEGFGPMGHKTFTIHTMGSEVTKSQAMHKCMRYGYNLLRFWEVKK